ncbi:leucine-rich repeat-containing protein 20 isoform X3 [Ursus maritimus]|uniref:Leucine-rich repeat-containing protein 20 isoform X3 n=1 Tax=Ursus maritimus TaxID=29073 RepID=A0A8M1FG86_URSMA|nr:leucine-rich repeat-containing protein 20 isoform X3 [Ursus maritimus]
MRNVCESRVAVQPLHYEKAQQASNVPICLSFTKDLAECKLVSFPIGIYKVLRNVTDQIHVITLANNELKSLTSKFVTTFCQLRELRLEGNFLHRLPNEVSTLQHLKAINLSRNQFRDFPEQLTTLPALETINLEENDIVGERPWPCGPCSSSLCPPFPEGFTGHRRGAPGSDLHRPEGKGELSGLRHLGTGH